MIGITSFGGYLPRLRLERRAIWENLGWRAPEIIFAAGGERSFCNWDEDSLTMAVSAARDCLLEKSKTKIDAVYLCSTTLPFADRLNAGILKTALNMKDELSAVDITSALRAGTIGLKEAYSAVKSGNAREALVVAADKRLTKTAQLYEMWFGDGAASVLMGKTDVIAEYLGSYTITCDFVDHYRGWNHTFDYKWEERFVRDMGYSSMIPKAVEGLLTKLAVPIEKVDKIAFPCLFQSERWKIAKKLGVGPDIVVSDFQENLGETGAAHPLVMLVAALEQAQPGERIVVIGFGQGCDALLFQVTDNIAKLPRNRGIKNSLERGKSTNNYMKYLNFRGLLPVETGIRAEAPNQTAMTVLWREREMILGLVGGQCKSCGTAQFPRARICVNPACRATDSQGPYEFADRKARIKTFTGDMLSVSVDPPNIYGLIQFDGGGRFMADFTDCDLDELQVGARVEMTFRMRYDDQTRGFRGYFWKAVPLPKETS